MQESNGLACQSWAWDSSAGRAPDRKARRNTGAGLSPGVAKIVLPESTSSADSLAVSIQPSCAVACINIRVHVKDPQFWQPYHWLDTEILHTHMGMGRAVLVATGPYKFSAMSKEVLPLLIKLKFYVWYNQTGHSKVEI